MTLQRKGSIDFFDKDDILELQLPKWNSQHSFREAWNYIIIQVQGDDWILNHLNALERNRLVNTLRSIRKSYDYYPLKNHTSVLITSFHKPILRIHLTDSWGFSQNWAQIDSQNYSIQENTFYSQKCISYLLYSCYISCVLIWSLFNFSA